MDLISLFSRYSIERLINYVCPWPVPGWQSDKLPRYYCTGSSLLATFALPHLKFPACMKHAEYWLPRGHGFLAFEGWLRAGRLHVLLAAGPSKPLLAFDFATSTTSCNDILLELKKCAVISAVLISPYDVQYFRNADIHAATSLRSASSHEVAILPAIYCRHFMIIIWFIFIFDDILIMIIYFFL
jgi:hypothetical protein